MEHWEKWKSEERTEQFDAESRDGESFESHSDREKLSIIRLDSISG